MTRKRAWSSLDTALVDLWQREIGAFPPRSFERTLGGAQDLVLRLQLLRKLEKHSGCVNTVSFNADGEILMSGSDDQRVILWDWVTGKAKLTFHSGHEDNVFQAKFMPYTEDRSIVTCAADGQVRHAEVRDGGHVETTLLATHAGRTHKLAVEPGSPKIFYSCGEDGLVQHFDLRSRTATELFRCYPRHNTYLPLILYAITTDPRKPNFFAVAGSNQFARLYDIRKYKRDGSNDFGQPVDCFCPSHLITNNRVGITGLAFSEQSELLVSYNSEEIYLFTGEMGLEPNPIQNSSCSLVSDDDENHMSDDSSLKPDVTENTTPKDDSSSKPDVTDKNTPRVYEGRLNIETVKGVSFLGPNCDYITSGSDCGRIFIWRKKDQQLMRVMEADKYVVNCVVSHPHTMVLASSGIDSDVKIWHPEAVERAALPVTVNERCPRNIFSNHDAFFFDLYADETDETDADDDVSEDKDEGDCDKNSYSSGESMDEDEEDVSDEELDCEAYESCHSEDSDLDAVSDDDNPTDD